MKRCCVVLRAFALLVVTFEMQHEEFASEASTETGRTLLSLAHACMKCRNENDLVAIARGPVRHLLPHRSLVAALGRIDLDHLEVLTLVGVDHPESALDDIKRMSNVRERSALLSWLQNREPIVLELPYDAHLMSELERREIENNKLGRVAAHGVLDLASREGSYFSFAGVPEGVSVDTLCGTLRLVVPHLHQALVAVHREASSLATPTRSLSAAERDLLRWVAAGRTNGEIAALRGRSPATVRNQLSALFRKLGVSNRAEAVRTAGRDFFGPLSNRTNVP